jgi:hypothetical protein
VIDISKLSDAISSFLGKAGASDLLQHVPVSELLWRDNLGEGRRVNQDETRRPGGMMIDAGAPSSKR